MGLLAGTSTDTGTAAQWFLKCLVHALCKRCPMQRISSLNIVDLLLDAVCMVQADSTIVFVSPAFERIFGYTPQEVVGRRILDMVHPEDLTDTRQEAQNIMNGALQLQFENRYIRKDGRIAHIRWTARWLPDLQLRLAVAHDITERKLHESRQAALYAISEATHAAQSLESLFQRIHGIIGRLVPATHFSVVLQDGSSGALLQASPAHENGATPGRSDALCAEVVRTGCAILHTPEDRQTPSMPPPADAPLPLYWLGVPLQTPSGTLGALVLHSDDAQCPYTDTDKELLQFVSTQVGAAIERQQMHDRLRHMAQHDTLTQLPNRALLLDRLHTALVRAQREVTLVSLLFVDLDDFKQVNDRLGHAMGDRLLQQVAQRLQGCVRAADTVARLGGDEFVLLLESGRTPDHAQAVARKVMATFETPFDLQGHPLPIQASVGVAVYPEHGSSASELLNHADRSMYQSKPQSGSEVHRAAAPPAKGVPCFTPPSN